MIQTSNIAPRSTSKLCDPSTGWPSVQDQTSPPRSPFWHLTTWPPITSITRPPFTYSNAFTARLNTVLATTQTHAILFRPSTIFLIIMTRRLSRMLQHQLPPNATNSLPTATHAGVETLAILSLMVLVRPSNCLNSVLCQVILSVCAAAPLPGSQSTKNKLPSVPVKPRFSLQMNA